MNFFSFRRHLSFQISGCHHFSSVWKVVIYDDGFQHPLRLICFYPTLREKTIKKMICIQILFIFSKKIKDARNWKIREVNVREKIMKLRYNVKNQNMYFQKFYNI